MYSELIDDGEDSVLKFFISSHVLNECGTIIIHIGRVGVVSIDIMGVVFTHRRRGLYSHRRRGLHIEGVLLSTVSVVLPRIDFPPFNSCLSLCGPWPEPWCEPRCEPWCEPRCGP